MTSSPEKPYFFPPPLDEPTKAIFRGLQKVLKPDQISLSWPNRLSYSRDCNSKGILWVKSGKVKYHPRLVVWPEKTEEVCKITSLANEHSMPLIPYGGGSGVCGGTWPIRGGVIVDLKRMDKVLQIDTQKMCLKAQAGINGELLERYLNRKGLTLGHFPASIYIATLGGYIACRSAGQYSTLYGKIEDMVEGLEAVLADGSCLKIEGVRDLSQAFDLKELFLGSEGTLGIITEADLKIRPRPEKELFTAFKFHTLERGIHAVREIMQRGHTPAVIRLYDPLDSLLATSYKEGSPFSWGSLGKVLRPLFDRAKNFSLKLLLKNPEIIHQIVTLLSGQSLLILGFHGLNSFAPVHLQAAEEICREYHGRPMGEGAGQYWLKHRYSVSYKLSPLFDQGYFADTLETATTWKNLLPLYHKVRTAIGKHALVLAHLSHGYSEGCSVYFTFVGFREDPDEAEALYDKIWEEGLAAVVQAGGTVSHHHGVGCLKGAHMEEEWGEAFKWLCKLKKKLDPKGIMNPGKLGFPV